MESPRACEAEVYYQTAMKRVAIVTGAAKPDSIGHAVALGLQEEGMQAVVADAMVNRRPSSTGASHRCARQLRRRQLGHHAAGPDGAAAARLLLT